MKVSNLIQKFIFIILFLMFYENSLSQNVIWLKVLQSYSEMYKTQQTSDGGFISVGIAQVGSFIKTFIVKLGPNGDSIWGKYYDLSVQGFYRGFWIEETHDKGFIINGSGEGPSTDAYLIKIDSIGNLLWVKIFSRPGLDQGRCVKELPDSGLILLNRTGSFPNEDVELIRTDSKGVVQWRKYYSGLTIGTEIDYVKDSGFIVAAYKFEGDLARLYLMRTDLNGDTIWTRTYYEFFRSGAYSIDVTDDGGFIIGGVADTSNNNTWKSYVVKTDSLGNIQWQKRYSSGFNEICYSIRKFKNTGYVFCGMSDSSYLGYERAIVRLIDNFGNIVHENYFRPGSSNNTFFSVEVSEKGLIICGSIAQGNFSKALIVRTDSTCQIHPVSIQNSNIIINGFKLNQNFPNPFNPETSISFELPKSEFVSLKIFDLNGKEIMTLVNNFKAAGYYSIKVDGSVLTSGVYFYKIRAGEFEETRKMMIVK